MTTRTTRWAGLAAVAAIWIVSAIANGMAGYQLANDQDLSRILAAASVSSDVLKAVALFIVLGAFLQRRWVAMTLALALFALSTGWSLRSAVYFASWSLADRANTLHHLEMVTETGLNILATKHRRAEFLAEQQVAPVSQYKSVRLAAAQANKETKEEFEKIMAEIEADLENLKKTAPVPVVDPLAKLLEVSPQRVALWTSLFFAGLLEMASSTGFWLVSRGRLPKPPRERRAWRWRRSVPQHKPAAALAPPADSPEASQEKLTAKMDVEISQVDSGIPQPGQIVDADMERLVRVLRHILVPGDVEDRVTLNDIAAAANRSLPNSKRLTTRYQRATQLCQAIVLAFPECEKKRAGGQSWVYGVNVAPRLAQSA